MSGTDDRRTRRALVNKDVVINGVTKAEALDISIDGMYIYTQFSFIAGTIFELSFKIGEDAIKVMARVQHAQPNVGIGVKFVELSAENSEKIKRYLEG
ncbi:MAG: PilZ domain-containing protein [Thermodesulfovibrionales bacterium]|nr:PilZ domain-containing protein [Thermodesulfovibrionales bacterium]